MKVVSYWNIKLVILEKKYHPTWGYYNVVNQNIIKETIIKYIKDTSLYHIENFTKYLMWDKSNFELQNLTLGELIKEYKIYIYK